MSTKTQKITLSPSRDIPFNKLLLSQANVRKIKAGVSIEELAEDIARRTLLQSLNVRAVVDQDGNETGMYEVPAGGRRYQALELLVKQKRMTKTQPVPCVVREGGIAEEDSLAENAHRENLHPLDQFRAFQALREKALDEEEIAARFFVTPTIVRQRLKLASVSPKLLDLYAEGEITLEQLMAFTVTNDHARQEQVWDSLQQGWNKEPYYIRRLLTESAVRASDRRAVFVGLEAYEAAGGLITRDLFESDGGGWLQDPALLDRLAEEKLKAEAEALADEGWKWISVATDFPYGHTQGLRRLTGEPVELTEDEQGTRESLQAEYDRLTAEYEDADELPDEVDERLGEIEALIEKLDERPVQYDPADIARAGIFVSLDADGDLRVERGFVRPDDEAPVDEPADTGAGEAAGPRDAEQPSRVVVITVGGERVDTDEDSEQDGIRPLSDRLVMELTAHRTLALRDAVANDPEAAMTALLFRLCLDRFGGFPPAGSCLEVSVRDVGFAAQGPDLKDCPSAQSIEARHEAWKAELPEDEDALWEKLAGLDQASRASLLAHCISYGVNALYEPASRYGGAVSESGVRRRLDHAHRLARAVGLDMVEAGWKPTAENYLGRVPKARILEAVREGKDERSAQLLDHLKKGEMAKEAERLLDGSGWLPEPLRTPDPDDGEPACGEDDAGASADLPDFLDGDDDADENAEEEPSDEERLLAAE